MARELAAAICDMATPSFQPVYIKVLACDVDDLEEHELPVAALVIHVRPKQASPCAEVAVFKGEVFGMWREVILPGPAAICDVPGTSGGLLAFLEDLVCSTTLWMMAEQEGLLQLSQPADFYSEQRAWNKVQLSVCSVDAVEVSTEAAWNGIVLTFPGQREPHRLLAYKEIRSKAAAFRRSLGSPTDTDEDYRRLRDKDVRGLVEGLALMFRQAFRYRGQLDLPAVPVDLED